MLIRLVKALVLVGVLVGVLSAPAAAQTLPEPTGEVILTISGNIATTNAGETARFDLEMLEALPAHEFTTDTEWTEGTHTFRGVRLGTLMETVGASGDTIRAIALNDYAIEIPMSDATDGSALVAYRMDGKTMSVRQKGPLWVVYPYASDPRFRSDVIYSRSIWQLDRLEVTD